MKIQVQIDGETHEVESSNIQLPEGYDFVSPENASSKGYFTQAQLDQKVKNRLSRAEEKVKGELTDNEDFLQQAANRKWGISFDEDGKPKGLKPEVDIEEVRQKAVQNVKQDYDKKIDNISNQAKTYKDRLIEQSILSATKGAWKEEFTKHQDNGRIKPIVVNQFKDQWDIDEKGNVALKDPDGGFVPNAKGQHITPDQYLTDSDKFGDYMIDRRQQGSDFQSGRDRNGKPTYSEKDIKNMSDEEYAKHRADILNAASEGRVN